MHVPAFRVAPWLGVIATLFAPPAAGAGEVRFGEHVAAVLSRAGCNQGTCHGNLNGKGGFKLSLRGEDPAFDFAALTRDAQGRRLDTHRPAESLILQKAAALMPHEGGRRFGPDSREYRLLHAWIAAGAPADPPGAATLTKLEVTPAEQILVEPAGRVRLLAEATFSDGRRVDVTGLCAFEVSNVGVAAAAGDGVVTKLRDGEAAVSVRYLDRQAVVRVAFVPHRTDFRWTPVPETNFVDSFVFARLKALRTNPSELAPDHVFLRRVYLDAIGVLPTVEETTAFLADAHPDKRSQLIDSLLKRPEFADFWALKWSDLLRNEEKTLDRKGVQAFHLWIRKAIADGVPLNEFARAVIAGRGSTYAQPAANFYRALRDPLSRAEATAQVFLGVRVQCARCHNHPFDAWKQDDYWRLAAFFPRVQYRVVENNRRDRFDKHEFDGEQVVWMDRAGELPHPRTKEPLRPKFLGGDGPDLPAGADRLAALADWVARPDNPFFARAQANRVWYHLLGRGLVEPIDDFRPTNPEAIPGLLDALARDFAGHQFDLRRLVRTILNSRTYQLSSAPNPTNADDETHFAHALVQPLEAEQLLDALAQAVGVPVKFDGQPLGVRAGRLPGVPQPARRGRPAGDAERFLKAFGKPDRLLSCECERSDDTTLLQAFQLLTGELLDRLLTEPDNRLGRLLKAGKSDRAIVQELTLAALCRPATEAELAAAERRVARAKDRRAALEDLLWAVVNAKEFQLRR